MPFTKCRQSYRKPLRDSEAHRASHVGHGEGVAAAALVSRAVGEAVAEGCPQKPWPLVGEGQRCQPLANRRHQGDKYAAVSSCSPCLLWATPSPKTRDSAGAVPEGQPPGTQSTVEQGGERILAAEYIQESL